MITFLPFEDFTQSAKVLDRLRLGKQRLETLWLLKQLDDKAYRNYPLVKMWKGFPNLLVKYGKIICLEWQGRGYEENLYDEICSFATKKLEEKPTWLGDTRLHASHRGRLLMKQPDWYGRFGWSESPRPDYFWPLCSLL